MQTCRLWTKQYMKTCRLGQCSPYWGICGFKHISQETRESKNNLKFQLRHLGNQSRVSQRDEKWTDQIEKGKIRWNRKEDSKRDTTRIWLFKSEPAFHTPADEKTGRAERRHSCPEGWGQRCSGGSEEQRRQTHTQHPTQDAPGRLRACTRRVEGPDAETGWGANRGAEWTAT